MSKQEHLLDPALEYMHGEHLAFFRELLLNWRREILEKAGNNMESLRTGGINYPDPTDRASQEESFNLELKARDRDRKLLKKIEGALQRLDNQDYGYCEDCGAEIGLKRLEARPTATRCIECKTVAEIKEKLVSEE